MLTKISTMTIPQEQPGSCMMSWQIQKSLSELSSLLLMLQHRRWKKESSSDQASWYWRAISFPLQLQIEKIPMPSGKVPVRQPARTNSNVDEKRVSTINSTCGQTRCWLMATKFNSPGLNMLLGLCIVYCCVWFICICVYLCVQIWTQ